jgi:hypothetical protein
MPDNHLDLFDSFDFTAGGLNEAQFNAVIDRAEAVYKPIFSPLGGNLKVERRWKDRTVNAYANQNGSDWEVHMFGGLARRPEVTEDGFSLVLGHECGHQIGGYPFVQDWAANEGQSDMHAAGAYAYKLFGVNLELAAKAATDLPPEMKAKCDKAYKGTYDREICYRTLVAGKSLADLLAALGSSKVAFNTPDTKVVDVTDNEHPKAQCRLDTYVASALCGNKNWDYGLIPGKALDHESVEAQNEAYAHSCPEGVGSRPKCWFAELSSN